MGKPGQNNIRHGMYFSLTLNVVGALMKMRDVLDGTKRAPALKMCLSCFTCLQIYNIMNISTHPMYHWWLDD